MNWYLLILPLISWSFSFFLCLSVCIYFPLSLSFPRSLSQPRLSHFQSQHNNRPWDSPVPPTRTISPVSFTHSFVDGKAVTDAAYLQWEELNRAVGEEVLHFLSLTSSFCVVVESLNRRTLSHPLHHCIHLSISMRVQLESFRRVNLLGREHCSSRQCVLREGMISKGRVCASSAICEMEVGESVQEKKETREGLGENACDCHSPS